MWPFKKKKVEAPKRIFAGAVNGRLTSDWIASSGSQDSEIKSSLVLLRNRSRQLIRDVDYCRSAQRAVRNNVIGCGIGMQSQVRMKRGGKLNSAVNSMIEMKWEKWKKKHNCHTAGMLDFSAMERTIMDSVFESGEIYVRLITQAMGDMKTPLALELIESDLLDESYNEVLGNGNHVKMGVELSKWGRPVAYHFRNRHPGDYSSVDYSKTSRVRIPADEILPLFITDRVNQNRGVPWLSSAIMRLRQMSQYEEAEIIAARATAALMGFIESPDGEVPSDGIIDGDRVTDFEPGVFKYLAPGEKVSVPNITRPGGQFDPFMRAMLRGVSAGAGVSYETISKDYSQSNYSSSRLSLLDDRDNWKVLQSWIICNFHEIVFKKWLDLSVLSGELEIKDYELNPDAYCVPKWMPRGWSWIDPAKEVQAYKDAIRCGFATQSEVIAQSGGDFEELMIQRAREIQAAEDLDLYFDTNPEDTQPNGSMVQDNEVEPPH
jgi:lambda family phage portal protein